MANIQRDKLINYEVFKEGERKLGTADVSLPDIEYKSDTMKGAGIAGEVEMPTMGQTGPMPVTINWRTLNEDVTDLLGFKAHSLDFRGAQQHYNAGTSEFTVQAVRVTVRAFPKKMAAGKFEGSNKTDSSNEMECVYLKIEIDGVKKIEIDKLNYVHYVNGVDYLEAVRTALGI